MTSPLSRRHLLSATLASAFAGCVSAATPRPDKHPVQIKGGRWWNGSAFVDRPLYVSEGRFALAAPNGVADVLDLSGSYLIPPFADAHNHGIGTGDVGRDRDMIGRYVGDGVLYMQSHGNLPLSPADKARLGLNGPSGLDVSLAQGSITGRGGHSMGFIRDRLLPAGWFPGHTLETLDNKRFFQVGSEEELARKWPAVLASQGDFVKFFLHNSGAHAKRKDDPAHFGRRGLDPALASSVVRRAHAAGFRASAHVVDVDDFRVALQSGADIVAHVPRDGTLAIDDAKRAADKEVVVITTCAFVARIAGNQRDAVLATQKRNLEALLEAGVHLAVGSDDPADTSAAEVEHLKALRLFSPAELLELWTNKTPKAIFPDRLIGRIEPGAEANFLALEGDPLSDWTNSRRVLARFKHGHRLPA